MRQQSSRRSTNLFLLLIDGEGGLDLSCLAEPSAALPPPVSPLRLRRRRQHLLLLVGAVCDIDDLRKEKVAFSGV